MIDVKQYVKDKITHEALEEDLYNLGMKMDDLCKKAWKKYWALEEVIKEQRKETEELIKELDKIKLYDEKLEKERLNGRTGKKR